MLVRRDTAWYLTELLRERFIDREMKRAPTKPATELSEFCVILSWWGDESRQNAKTIGELISELL